MLKKFTETPEFEKSIALSAYAFNAAPSKEDIAKNKELLQHTTNWGIFDGDLLASQVLVLPYQVNLAGKELKMAGIGNVATYPDYRGTGSINQLFTGIFEELKNNQTVLSYLNPFNQEFYRKYGYEVIFYLQETVIQQKEIAQLPFEKTGSIRRSDKTQANVQSILKELYRQTLQKDDGSLIREDWWWDLSFKYQTEELLAISYDDNNCPNGYLIYQMTKTEMEIIEIVYLKQSGLNKILGFIASHQPTFKTFRFKKDLGALLPLVATNNKEVKQTLIPSMMVKIISFKGLIEKMSFNLTGSQRFYLGVSDEYSSWNHGTWEITIKAGQAQAELIDTDLVSKNHLVADIQTWAQVLLKSTAVSNLVLLERLKINDIEEGSQFLNSLKETHLGLHDFF